MAYEATAELYKRQYDLAKKRAQSEYESAIGDLATQYRQANLDLEGNLEGRGILRSGEGMRSRVRLGAAEKAAQLAAETTRQGALDQAGLSYMQQLAELQAKGYTGGTPGTGGDGGGTGGIVDTIQPVEPPKETPSETPSETPADRPPKPGNPPAGFEYVWDGNQWVLRALAVATPPTVGGRPVGPGETPREVNPPLNVLPAPGGYIGGPDRKLSNGGGVVNGIYIPPGIDWGALAPRPTTTSGGGGGTVRYR